ncbi:Lrp/AsnC family transcriptional regulator [Noviherbaspirillum galbum]|uniref:Lrp/AsnC family transcriptional regulator n=1 Tax=Noviherbaspirillum galbum TaxID=2709383 RepID=A0A6B3SI44_9BURK|nr:Lrp/AsnC family transcriptional regulator [Noviherbaspirillum galbum]NEX60524.1 Lrp/AsnC family transcriptional regulator [Noviherbaspirillum galbum]
MKTRFEADPIDWKILALLQRDARITNTGLGKAVGLSASAVAARIRVMEEAGVIEGYSARVNARALGQEITAFIRVRTPHDKIKQCLKAFAAMPEILEAHRIAGDDCFMVKASFSEMPHLEATLDALARFGPVTTSLVLDSYPPKPLQARK